MTCNGCCTPCESCRSRIIAIEGWLTPLSSHSRPLVGRVVGDMVAILGSMYYVVGEIDE